MEKTLYKAQTIDTSTGEILSESRVIRKFLPSIEKFIQTYIQDIGVLLKCSKGQIDLLVCIILNGYIEFDTNEVILNASRRKELSSCSCLKMNTIYSLLVALKSKNIIVSDGNREYLNPKLFFFGSEMARNKMFELKINYTIDN